MSTAEKGTQRFIQRVFPQQGGGSSGGTTTVTPTWTTLAAINDLLPGFPIGALVVTQSQGSVWELRALQTALAGKIITASSGTHSWVRVADAWGQWQGQTVFHVDNANTSGNASDENSGLTNLVPLLTVDEVFMRTQNKWYQAVTVFLDSDYLLGGPGVSFLAGQNGNINAVTSDYYGGLLTIQGVNKTPSRTSSLTAVTNGNRVTGVETQITDGVFDFTPLVGRVINFTVSGAQAVIKRTAGAGKAVLAPVFDPNTFGIFVLAGNEAYTVLNPVKIGGQLTLSSFGVFGEVVLNDVDLPLNDFLNQLDVLDGTVFMSRVISSNGAGGGVSQVIEQNGVIIAIVCVLAEFTCNSSGNSNNNSLNFCLLIGGNCAINGSIELIQSDSETSQINVIGKNGRARVGATDSAGGANSIFIYGTNVVVNTMGVVQSDGGLVFLNQGAVANCIDVNSNGGIVGIGATAPIVVGAAPTNAQVRLGSPALARTTTFGAGLICEDTLTSYHFIAGAAPSGTTMVSSGNVGMFQTTPSFGTASVGVLSIGNATTIPTGNPTAATVLFTDPADGKLKARTANGIVTTLAP